MGYTELIHFSLLGLKGMNSPAVCYHHTSDWCVESVSSRMSEDQDVRNNF